MKDRVRVLIFGRHPNMLEKAIHLLEQEGPVAYGHTTNEGILAYLLQYLAYTGQTL